MTLKPALAVVMAAMPVMASAQGETPSLPAVPDTMEAVPVALLVDLGSGQTLYARAAERPFPPASMTKVMTAFVAFQEMAEGRLLPDRVFTVDPDTARTWSGRGTSLYLDAGERISAHDLLRGIMTASANDAAVVLAEGYAGSVEGWTDLMNGAARQLGMKGSRFSNPSGWPDGGKTRATARDLAILARAVLREHPEFYRSYSGKLRMEWKRVTLFSHDPVTGVIPGADGIKTGFTREAGYNFLGSGQRDGRRLVMVIAGAPTEAARATAARGLLEWGFEKWRARHLFAAQSPVAHAQVQGGAAARVALISDAPVYAAVPSAGQVPIALRVHYRGPLRAPIAKGAQIAELEIAVAGMEPARIPLKAAAPVAAAGFFDRIRNGFRAIFS